MEFDRKKTRYQTLSSMCAWECTWVVWSDGGASVCPLCVSVSSMYASVSKPNKRCIPDASKPPEAQTQELYENVEVSSSVCGGRVWGCVCVIGVVSIVAHCRLL